MPLLTFRSRSISVEDFCHYVAHESGVSIVTDATVGKSMVTMELQDQPLDQVLSSLARHLNTHYHQVSPSLYFLGAIREQDEAVLVRRVRGLSAVQIMDAVETVSVKIGVTAYADGLVVCSGIPDSLRQVSDVFDQIEASRPGVWCVQLYLVTMTRDDMTELGLDLVPALDVALTYGVGSNSVSAGKLNVGLSALLSAARNRSTMAVTAEPLFYLVDGEKATFERATEVPIPRRTVSDQGTVTTTGYDKFKAGTVVEVAVREVAGGSIRLSYDLELSSLRAMSSDGFPSSDRRTYNGVSHVQSGGTYLLGSIDLTEERTGRGTWLHSGILESHTAEVMQIWARAVTVQGPALVPEQNSIAVVARSEPGELRPGHAGEPETPAFPDSLVETPPLNPLRKGSQK